MMFLFSRETPRHFYPPGADPTLDRPIPQKAAGLPCMVIVLLVMVVVFCVVLFLLSRKSAAKQVVWVTDTPGALVEAAAPALTEPATVPPTAALDDWSRTGTAIFLATFTPTPSATPPPDWCWFLTPSPAFLPTLYVTADAPQLAATRLALETGTPTATPAPTDAPPRAWCNEYIPGPDADAMTATQHAWPTAGQLPSVEAPATWTPVPPRRAAPAQVVAATQEPPIAPPPTSEPRIIVLTAEPQIIILPATSQIIIVTATFAPTHLPTATETPTDAPTATLAPTDTATATPTDTPSEVPTDVPTATATDTPTDIPSAEMTEGGAA